MAESYDVIVAGLGAMGSAAAYHLAKRGQRVLGLDRFAPPHELGSSHGLTRIIREAYYEQPLYVPLVRRAFDLWRELEHDAGLTEGGLLVRNGGLTFGRPDTDLVRGVLESAAVHGVPIEQMDASACRRRFPRYTVRDEWTVIFEPTAGFVRPELIISTHLDLARRLGASILPNTSVLSWNPTAEGVRVETSNGSFEAGYLVVCTGAWTRELLGDVELPLTVERQVSNWFRAVGNASFRPNDMPVTMWQLENDRIFYTTPDVGRGVKAAFHYGGEVTSVAEVRRSVSPDEVEESRRTFAQLVPDAAGEWNGSVVCLYTNTPDLDFLIDQHPEDERVLIVSACSGHGFKFSAAIGEVVSDLVTGYPPHVDIAPFSLSRFTV